MTYDEAITYLKGLTKFGMNLGLGRIQELLRRLGNPHRRLNIIHVGGTNGKGSTTAMIAGILRAAGYKTGMFTSPHLHSYTERFLINGRPIAEAKLAQLLTEIRPHMDNMVAEGFEHPTEFEVSTALALLYFAMEETDYVALEVGLGGAIDSTNVVTPLVSVITNVTLDHMDHLGSTVEEIARVKSGIIKKGVPVVTAAEGVALEVIWQAAKANQSRLILVGKDVTWSSVQPRDNNGGYQQFKIKGLHNHYHIQLPLLGSHQRINAATAVAAVEMLFSNGGHPVPAAAVVEGLQRVHWPGRLEVVRKNPTVLLDGAHNHAGARALRQALLEYFPDRQLIFVLGMLADKERSKVVAELAPLAKAVVVTRSNHPRAGDWTKLADYVKKYLEDVMIIEDVRQAVKTVLDKARQDDILCITGSLYMVAEARSVLGLSSV
ncbi:dihydrofolate synthase / folylpolyglutamate synthase [Desulforamulus putei DSM 12395]|uniref:tetrahydrofolate synthase n=1 Tax=Desulforamulus putei DSM 12395 TaxID=1121429 RepID=A0A1M4U884_9FIRM|nr:folylpolyglutamate synthase/dihydrofolate synthase family protein [Desulforamulus putei]SHE52773.1 dihydrofolate synthase / folylpolyglutamate synthase [Desulforamulus putei DSM 12395]